MYLHVTMPSTKNANGDTHIPQRLRNLFRIGSHIKEGREKDGHIAASATPAIRTEAKSSSNPFSKSKFFTGRLRSTTVASEGNVLDDSMSPTANANPYFAHQGQPGLRHHNEGSVPPSPPDTPSIKIAGANGVAAGEPTIAATKEELARKLRRVASAPNAQGLFNKASTNGAKSSGERPATAELSKEPLVGSVDTIAFGLAESPKAGMRDPANALVVRENDDLAPLQPIRSNLAFRRTYSSNSIKIRDVEVGPQSFDKIKLIGKGDVGKVYLVKEKKSNRLYAMKGMPCRRS